MFVKLSAVLPSTPQNSATTWVPLINIPVHVLEDWPNEYQLVAFLRYAGSRIVGCLDGEVYRDSARIQRLPPGDVLSAGTYFFFPTLVYDASDVLSGRAP